MKRTILLLALAALVGCGGNYYRVTDSSSAKVYYTRDVDKRRRTDAVHFTDAKTGAKVTIQSSVVEKISEAEYQKGLGSAK